MSGGIVAATVTEPAVYFEALPDDFGKYAGQILPVSPSLLGEEEVSLKGTGDEVPPFEVVMTVPLVILLSSPEHEDGVVTVFTTQENVLTWTRGAEDVHVVAGGRTSRQVGDNFESLYLFCVFDGALGEGVIPPEALSEFPEGHELALRTMKRLVQAVGEYEVTFQLVTALAAPDRSTFLSLKVGAP